MMNYFNGFDALEQEEFDALMSDLTDEITEELAQEFASPETQAQLHARYQLIVIWNDISSKTESCNDIVAAMNAAAIYMMDNTCIRVSIYDWQEKKDILDWNR